jgi:hypothetical protein
LASYCCSEDFYQAHRWGSTDLVAAVVMVVPPVLAFCFLAVRFLRAPR